MDIFIAGVILIVAVAWGSAQELLDVAPSKPDEASETMGASPNLDQPAGECVRGQPPIIARDLTVSGKNEAPAYDP
jgi:hypothetical protein